MGRCIALARRTGQCGCGSTPWARRTDCGRTPMKLQTHRGTVTKYHNSISLYLPLTLYVYRALHGYQLGSLTVQTITVFFFQDFDFASVWVISFRFWFGRELESFGGLFISWLGPSQRAYYVGGGLCASKIGSVLTAEQSHRQFKVGLTWLRIHWVRRR